MEKVYKEDDSNHLVEAHFFSLASQGNVYTISTLVDENGFEKILVATLQRKVYCIEYLNCRPYMREIIFPYFLGNAEIVSICALRKCNERDEFIVAISLIKKNESPDVAGELNFYSWEVTVELPPDCVSNINLNFVPYYLCEQEAISNHQSKTVWLLSGGDQEIHLYTISDIDQSYHTEDVGDLFPEFKDLPSIVIKLDVLYHSSKQRRTSVICGENGIVMLFNVELTSGTPKVTSSQSIINDFLASSVALFTSPGSDESVSTVVANCFESSFIFRKNLDKSSCETLQLSDSSDVVTCCLVCDLYHSGDMQVLLGFYGQIVRIYKEEPKDKEWVFASSIKVPFPVLALKYLDVVGDGTKQLIIMTISGIHIYQHDPRKLATVILERLKTTVQQQAKSSICP